MELIPKISSSQTVALLLVCRFFTLLVSVPSGRFTIEGSGALLLPVFSVLMTLAAFIPLYFLRKSHPDKDICTAACQIAPVLRWPVTLWLLFLCLIAAVSTAGQSQYFITTSLYPRADQWSVLLLFMLAVWYIVSMGIEAMGRVSLIVCALMLMSFGLICGGSFHHMDLLSLGHPFYEGTEKLLMTGVAYWGQNLELILFVLLRPFSREKTGKRDMLVFLIGAFLSSELIYFFALTVLGDYGKTRLFPIYTLSSVAGTTVFTRLDYLHIISWILICLLRCALYTAFGVRLIHQLLPSVPEKIIRALSGAAILTAAMMQTGTDSRGRLFYTGLASGLPVLLTISVLPAVLLMTERIQKRRKGGKADGQK